MRRGGTAIGGAFLALGSLPGTVLAGAALPAWAASHLTSPAPATDPAAPCVWLYQEVKTGIGTDGSLRFLRREVPPESFRAFLAEIARARLQSFVLSPTVARSTP